MHCYGNLIEKQSRHQMNNYSLSRITIGNIMRELDKNESIPRLENAFNLAAQSLWTEYTELGTTLVLEDSMNYFLRTFPHSANKLIRETGVENLTSASVIQFYINDSEFFSKKGNALQSLIFIKEAIQHHAVFADTCIVEKIQDLLRAVDVYTPEIINDLFSMLQIPHSTHTSIVLARPNTEILILK